MHSISKNLDSSANLAKAALEKALDKEEYALFALRMIEDNGESCVFTHNRFSDASYEANKAIAAFIEAATLASTSADVIQAEYWQHQIALMSK